MSPAVPFPVPASMLRARAREKEFERLQAFPATTGQGLGHDPPSPDTVQAHQPTAMDVVEAVGWKDILDEFEFPEVYGWDADEAPARVMEQLIGQTIGFGMTVQYAKRKYLVVDLDIRPDELGQVMRGDDLDAYWRPIIIVLLEHIDLTT